MRVRLRQLGVRLQTSYALRVGNEVIGVVYRQDLIPSAGKSTDLRHGCTTLRMLVEATVHSPPQRSNAEAQDLQHGAVQEQTYLVSR